MQLGREYYVAIMQQALVSLHASRGLLKLLPRPLRRQMRCHVEVNESRPAAGRRMYFATSRGDARNAELQKQFGPNGALDLSIANCTSAAVDD